MELLVGYFAATGGLSLISGWLVYPLLVRWNVIDRPNERSSHVHPTARGGGIGFLAVILIGFGIWAAETGHVQYLPILIAAFVVAVVSFVDDLRSLSAGLRFGCHGLAAGTALWVLERNGLLADLGLPNTVAVRALALAVMFVWIVGYTNAFNFMDGINGISAMQGVICALGAVTLAMLEGVPADSPPLVLLVVIAGANAGFLPHNFPGARMFMGDVGGAPLGYLLAAATLWLGAAGGWGLFIPLMLLHANYVLDTGITLLRRILRGDKWYSAHREHFYQRLQRAGRSHVTVTLVEAALLLISVGLLASLTNCGLGARVAVMTLVVCKWLVFFAYAEREFQRSCNN